MTMISQPEIGVSWFRSDEAGRVTGDALQAWHREGLLVIEDFASLDQCRQLILEADAIVEDFDEEEVAAIFSTTSQQHAASEYFETSGDKIRCFFEENAFNDEGKLVVPKSRSINKIGHALHDVNPVFEYFSYQPRLANLVTQLGISEPQWLQSMLIFKQPAIGGEVMWHQDGSFLYTVPQSVIGFWLRLKTQALKTAVFGYCLASIKMGCVHVFGASTDGCRRKPFQMHRVLMKTIVSLLRFQQERLWCWTARYRITAKQIEVQNRVMPIPYMRFPALRSTQ